MVERRLETVHELVSIPENNQQCLAIGSKSRDTCQEEAEIKRDLTRKHSGESEGNANHHFYYKPFYSSWLIKVNVNPDHVWVRDTLQKMSAKDDSRSWYAFKDAPVTKWNQKESCFPCPLIPSSIKGRMGAKKVAPILTKLSWFDTIQLYRSNPMLMALILGSCCSLLFSNGYLQDGWMTFFRIHVKICNVLDELLGHFVHFVVSLFEFKYRMLSFLYMLFIALYSCAPSAGEKESADL